MDDDQLLREISEHEPPAAGDAEPPRPAPQQPERRGIPPWVKIAAVFLVLGGGVALLLSGGGGDDPFVYSTLVDEVMSDPEEWAGREIRVEGTLRRGSVAFVDEPSCEHRFVLEREGHSMPVSFPHCVVPDTFRDDMPQPITVVVEGQLHANGTFVADQVIPRCASHYDEMQNARENGLPAPHALPDPS